MTKLNKNKNESFQDYTNAENSDDEEKCNDLQSRLYAEIYYAPHVEDINATISNKLSDSNDYVHINVPSSNPNFDLQEAQTKSNDNKKSPEVPSLCKNQSNAVPQSINKFDAFHQAEIPNNANVNATETKERENLFLSNVGQNKLCKNNKNKETLIEHFDGQDQLSINCSTGNTGMTESFLKLYDNYNCAKKKKSKKSLHSKKTEIFKQSLYQDEDQSSSDMITESTMESVDTPSGKNKTKSKVLKKYEFSKKIINKLYMDKQNKSQNETQEDEQECFVSNEQSNNTEMDTRYNVVEKSKKKQSQANNASIKKVCDDSDSDESVFEVPIPPKPAPLVINLQDSDEEKEDSINDTDVTTANENRSLREKSPEDIAQSMALIESASSNSQRSSTNNAIVVSNEFNSCEAVESNEDIVLNCTNVQKDVLSVEDINKCTQKQNCYVQKMFARTNMESGAGDSEAENPMEDSVQTEQDSGEPNPANESFIVDSGSIIENLQTFDVTAANVDFTDDNSVLKYHMTFIKDKRKQKIQDQGNLSGPCSSAPPETIESEQLFTFDNIGNIENIDCVDLTDVSYTEKDTNYAVQLQTSCDDRVQTSRKRHHDVFNESEVSLKQAKHKDNRYLDNPTSSDSHYLKNFDVEEIQNGMSNDPKLWKISEDDIMQFKRDRFWNVRCSHCHRRGHCRYNCPEPRKIPTCHMCGTQGHVETRCPHKICLTCGKKQNLFRKTCETCRTFYCTTCNSIGHRNRECPDLWRRYHQTTSKTNVSLPMNWESVMKPPHLLHCCNCAKRGHESSMCQEYRWSQHFPTPPFVSNYMKGSFYTDIGCTIPTPLNSVPSTSGTLPSSNNDSNLLYAYSSFYTTVPMKRSNTMKQTWNKLQKIGGLLEKRVLPTFLERMPNMIKFRIRMSRDEDRVIVNITAYGFSPHMLYKLLDQWLLTDDDEKDHRILTDLPIDDRDMFVRIIQTKLDELEVCKDEPLPLWKEVCNAKETLESTYENKEASLEHLLSLKKRLIAVMYKQQGDPIIKKLRIELRKISRRKSNEVIPLEVYFHILLMYNEIFAPYTSRRLQRYIGRLQRNEENPNKAESKKQPHRNKLNKISSTIQSVDSNIQIQSVIPQQIQPIPSANQFILETETSTLQVESNPKDTNVEITPEASMDGQGHGDHHTIAQLTNNSRLASTESPKDFISAENTTNIYVESVPFLSAETSAMLMKRHRPGTRLTSNRKVQNVNVTDKTFEVRDEVTEIYNTECEKRNKSRKKKKCKTNETVMSKKFMKKAHNTVHRAFKLGIPSLSKVAKDIMKKIKSNVIQEKDIVVLQQLISMEEEHHKQVQSLYQCLK